MYSWKGTANPNSWKVVVQKYFDDKPCLAWFTHIRDIQSAKWNFSYNLFEFLGIFIKKNMTVHNALHREEFWYLFLHGKDINSSSTYRGYPIFTYVSKIVISTLGEKRFAVHAFTQNKMSNHHHGWLTKSMTNWKTLITRKCHLVQNLWLIEKP